ncbi:MAG TPA: metalloregulator ArsR/SmtB family transcription factor [Usitatibacteraceae bacterium]
MPTKAPARKTDRATASSAARRAAAKAAKKLPTEDVSEDIFALIGKSENIEQAAVAMQAMSHPLRIKILCMLSSGEMIVQDIVDAVGTTQSNVSQHLRILKDCGIVGSRKDATRIYYRIEDRRIVRMITLTRDIFCGI